MMLQLRFKLFLIIGFVNNPFVGGVARLDYSDSSPLFLSNLLLAAVIFLNKLTSIIVKETQLHQRYKNFYY